MKCPACGKEDNKVFDSRPAQDGRAVRRRRECLRCGNRFTTYEYIERTPLMIIKRDESREPYDRNKLITGITLACRKRPVSCKDIEKIVQEIETRIADENKLEIESKELGEMVLEKLVEIDQVAYVRFASVYRAFRNADEFTLELKRLRRR